MSDNINYKRVSEYLTMGKGVSFPTTPRVMDLCLINLYTFNTMNYILMNAYNEDTFEMTLFAEELSMAIKGMGIGDAIFALGYLERNGFITYDEDTGQLFVEEELGVDGYE